MENQTQWAQEPQLLRTRDVLQLLNIKPAEIDEYVGEGRLRRIRIGTSVRYLIDKKLALRTDANTNAQEIQIHPQRLLRESDVANLLSISTDQVGRYVRAGLLPRVQIGKSVRFRPDDVKDFYDRLIRYGEIAPPNN